ncbi:nucleotidyltransferase family protein [Rathayibacter sp. YIM 133350]|uniref:nucleotidyltransferase family protein n=1 Tax=Rathayibacter sp. YIM 133350 TaxID=3131992 RepID=UPI00307DCB10
MSLRSVPLRTGEAVELGHALIERTAADACVRVLFIKGPSLAFHGLREARASADVDVLVSPSDEDALLSPLRSAGWHERPYGTHDKEFVTHSVTLIHEGWPCDLDVHRAFPGFLADAGEVFDALWERRVVLTQANHEIAVPDRAASILILALHSLRGSVKIARHATELDGLVERLRGMTDAERDDLVELARRTGCRATLAPFFERIGAPLGAGEIDWDDPAYVLWRKRVESGSIVAHFWLELVGRLPWHRVPRETLRAFWPSPAEMRIIHPETAAGWRAVTAARWNRLLRGTRDVGPVLASRRRVARERRAMGERR